MFLLSSISLVQVNLALELFENRIFVREPNGYYLEFFVRKPNCSNSETFENRGLTVVLLRNEIWQRQDKLTLYYCFQKYPLGEAGSIDIANFNITDGGPANDAGFQLR